MSNQNIDPIIPKLLIQAVKDAFSIQASTPVTLHQVSEATASDVNDTSIAAVISMVGAEVEGTLALCFEERTLLGVLNRMIGESYTQINKENVDAAGELLNIVYASARVKINESAGYVFQPALPTVLQGKDLSVSHQNSGKVARASFKTEFGNFCFEVSVRKKAQKVA